MQIKHTGTSTFEFELENKKKYVLESNEIAWQINPGYLFLYSVDAVSNILSEFIQENSTSVILDNISYTISFDSEVIENCEYFGLFILEARTQLSRMRETSEKIVFNCKAKKDNCVDIMEQIKCITERIDLMQSKCERLFHENLELKREIRQLKRYGYATDLQGLVPYNFVRVWGYADLKNVNTCHSRFKSTNLSEYFGVSYKFACFDKKNFTMVDNYNNYITRNVRFRNLNMRFTNDVAQGFSDPEIYKFEYEMNSSIFAYYSDVPATEFQKLLHKKLLSNGEPDADGTYFFCESNWICFSNIQKLWQRIQALIDQSERNFLTNIFICYTTLNDLYMEYKFQGKILVPVGESPMCIDHPTDPEYINEFNLMKYIKNPPKETDKVYWSKYCWFFKCALDEMQ
jgi:hypothetical protein